MSSILIIPLKISYTKNASPFPAGARVEALYAASQTPEYTGKDVKELRSRLNVSQSVLAALINTSASAVRAWEAGTKKPGGPSNKLLQLLDTKGLELFLLNRLLK